MTPDLKPGSSFGPRIRKGADSALFCSLPDGPIELEGLGRQMANPEGSGFGVFCSLPDDEGKRERKSREKEEVGEYGICERRSRECGCGRVWNMRTKKQGMWLWKSMECARKGGKRVEKAGVVEVRGRGAMARANLVGTLTCRGLRPCQTDLSEGIRFTAEAAKRIPPVRPGRLFSEAVSSKQLRPTLQPHAKLHHPATLANRIKSLHISNRKARGGLTGWACGEWMGAALAP